MRGEIRRQSEVRKVEKEGELNEATKKHLKYIEKIEASALEFIKRDIQIKQNKFGPADMTNEFAIAQRMEEIIDEFSD